MRRYFLFRVGDATPVVTDLVPLGRQEEWGTFIYDATSGHWWMNDLGGWIGTVDVDVPKELRVKALLMK